MKYLMAAITCLAFECSATFADVINFETIDGAVFNPPGSGNYSAPGLFGKQTIGSNIWDISNVTGTVRAINLFSDTFHVSANSIGLYGPSEDASAASITLSGGGSFLFNSLSLIGQGTGVATISGFLGLGPAIVESFNYSNFGLTANNANSLLGQEIDRLEINFVGTGASQYFGVDNINVTALAPPATVAEPSSFAILMLGGAGFWLKRRRQAA